MTALRLLLVLLVGWNSIEVSASECNSRPFALQVLGSGGPELNDKRASTSYLIWIDGKARILIDLGPGSLVNFEHSGADVADLDAILLTHLHVDHSADLPALIKGSFFSQRDRDLPILGPSGSKLFPSVSKFVQTLFLGPDGAFRYLEGFVSGYARYKVLPQDVSARGKALTTAIDDERFKISTVPVHHGPIPALAWRIDVGEKSIVISGDMNGDNHTLEQLAQDADLLVAHHAIPEGLEGVARNLHMPPSVIGEIASSGKVASLLLTHRMQRTLGREQQSSEIIRQRYNGPLAFAEDRQCIVIE
jgi:ribonuclease BN (tRNA processing enzyme)